MVRRVADDDVIGGCVYGQLAWEGEQGFGRGLACEAQRLVSEQTFGVELLNHLPQEFFARCWRHLTLVVAHDSSFWVDEDEGWQGRTAMAISERAPRSTPHEGAYTLPPETSMGGTVSEQAIIDLLAALPIPITITQEKDPRNGKPYYTYQVGEKTEEYPIGLGIGSRRQFLDAVHSALMVALHPQPEE